MRDVIRGNGVLARVDALDSSPCPQGGHMFDRYPPSRGQWSIPPRQARGVGPSRAIRGGAPALVLIREIVRECPGPDDRRGARQRARVRWPRPRRRVHPGGQHGHRIRRPRHRRERSLPRPGARARWAVRRRRAADWVRAAAEPAAPPDTGRAAQHRLCARAGRRGARGGRGAEHGSDSRGPSGQHDPRSAGAATADAQPELPGLRRPRALRVDQGRRRADWSVRRGGQFPVQHLSDQRRQRARAERGRLGSGERREIHSARCGEGIPGARGAVRRALRRFRRRARQYRDPVGYQRVPRLRLCLLAQRRARPRRRRRGGEPLRPAADRFCARRAGGEGPGALLRRGRNSASLAAGRGTLCGPAVRTSAAGARERSGPGAVPEHHPGPVRADPGLRRQRRQRNASRQSLCPRGCGVSRLEQPRDGLVTSAHTRNQQFSRAAPDTFALSSYQFASELGVDVAALQLHTDLARQGRAQRADRLSELGSDRSGTGGPAPLLRVAVPSTEGGSVVAVAGSAQQAQGPFGRGRALTIGDELSLPWAGNHALVAGVQMERFRVLRGGS